MSALFNELSGNTGVLVWVSVGVMALSTMIWVSVFAVRRIACNEGWGAVDTAVTVIAGLGFAFFFTVLGVEKGDQKEGFRQFNTDTQEEFAKIGGVDELKTDKSVSIIVNSLRDDESFLVIPAEVKNDGSVYIADLYFTLDDETLNVGVVNPGASEVNPFNSASLTSKAIS